MKKNSPKASGRLRKIKSKKDMRSIALFKVYMPQSAIRSVTRTLESGYVSEGEISHEFEKEFQRYIGNPHISLVNSGTSALVLALRMAGVGDGDEVISTPMTCLATNEPIMMTGARIVWADIDPTTGNIDPVSVAKRITPRTKAIMVVHWGGNPVDMAPLAVLAKKHDLKIIEDAAHAIGSTYDKKKIGNHADFVCFSFQAVKTLTTVDGGALAVKDKKAYDRAVLLRWYGCARAHTRAAIKWVGDVYEPGYKMHMNDMNASIGREQLKYVDWIVKKHQQNAAFVSRELGTIKEIELPHVTSRGTSSFWLFTIKLPDAGFRERFSKELHRRNVGNGIVHQRNDTYALFEQFRHSDLPGVDDFCSRMLNIPCGWWLSKSDLNYIVRSVKEAVSAATRV